MVASISSFNLFLEKAILEELNRSLAFGCVNKFSNGSHIDMTYQTFIASSKIIRKELSKIVWNSIVDFASLRICGYRVEKAMYEKTSGINTHKGLIFLIMFLALFYTKYGYIEGKEDEIASFANPVSKDYKSVKKATNWHRLKINDIRYFPLTGFSDLINLSKETYMNNFENTILTLKLISLIDDTTTINRSSLKTITYVQKEAKKILLLNKSEKEMLIKKANILNNFYLKNNLSSGGVADAFTIVKLLTYIREDAYGKNISQPNKK
ncbi:MAG: triphosphoribosyl-dephospho-CoA synthase [Peptoniphilaceae bacterium]|nr:triphosphoribosyl-dephospho-CoA synthase [Peptoniphilaceae bacterium]MDY6018839.1 triphosphoribosyl-dephospho-CoA synthase [Anaerococcus sp.]